MDFRRKIRKLRVIAVSLFLLVSASLFAQENEKKVYKYSYMMPIETGCLIWCQEGGALETTFIPSIGINKKHLIGFGLGIWAGRYSHTYFIANIRVPLFVNYRLDFKPKSKYAPYINVAMGAHVLRRPIDEFYSSIAAGFRIKEFTCSLGIPFIVLPCNSGEDHWDYLFGISIKIGFSGNYSSPYIGWNAFNHVF